jgi:hypothetical protein
MTNINAEELKIVFYTNLVDEANEKIVFQRDMLYHPELKSPSSLRLNAYPFYTSQVKYPVGKLKVLSYSEVVEFFFNEKKFVSLLRNEEAIKKGHTEDFNKKQSEIIEHNIHTMFEVLFPTNFPNRNDHHTSYDLIHGKNTAGSIFTNPLSSGKFSYMKIANKTYTFKTLVWINDLLNHPDYEALLETANKLRESAIHKHDEVKNIQTRNLEDISERMDEVVDMFFKGLTKSMEHVGKGKNKEITLGKDTSEYILRLFSLHSMLHIILGNSKENYSDLIQSKIKELKKGARGEVGGFDEVIALVESRLTEALSKTYVFDFLKRQQDVLGELSSLKLCGRRLHSILSMRNASGLTTITTNEIKEVLRGLNAKVETICKKRADIEKEFASYAVLDEIVKGEPSKTSYSKEPTLSAAYKKFEYNLRKYKSPVRTSSNLFLQNMIHTKDDAAITKLLLFCDKTYLYYMENDAEKLTPKEEQLLNVGVSEVNSNDSNSPHYEICVMADFFDGELTNENKSKIYCPYTSEYLGDELVRLVEREPARNLLWVFEHERKIFSVEKITAENAKRANSKQTMELREGPRIREEEGQLRYHPGREEEIQKKDNSELYAWLSTDVIKDNALEGALEKINKFTMPKDWGKDEVLDFLMKYNKDLYNVIRTVYAKKDRYENKLQVELVGLRGKYDSKLEQNAIALQNKALDNPGKEEEKNKLLFDNELQQFYLIIVRYLLDVVSKRTGGKRKAKTMRRKRRANHRSRRLPLGGTAGSFGTPK